MEVNLRFDEKGPVFSPLLFLREELKTSTFRTVCLGDGGITDGGPRNFAPTRTYHDLSTWPCSSEYRAYGRSALVGVRQHPVDLCGPPINVYIYVRN